MPRKNKSAAPVVKDSGRRQEFKSGARRDIEAGKGRFDLIPDDFLEALAQLYEQGALKYGADNWIKGMPLRRYKNSALRHLVKWSQGMRDEPHLIQAIWNLISMWMTDRLIESGYLPDELRDLSLKNVLAALKREQTQRKVPVRRKRK